MSTIIRTCSACCFDDHYHILLYLNMVCIYDFMLSPVQVVACEIDTRLVAELQKRVQGT